MATKTIIACDVCGKHPATTFKVAGAAASGTVDLCAEHAKALDAALRPFLGRPKKAQAAKKTVAKRTTKKAAAQPAGKKATAKKATKKATARKRTARPSPAGEIRAWGYANGFNVASHGRLSPALVEAFDAASK